MSNNICARFAGTGNCQWPLSNRRYLRLSGPNSTLTTLGKVLQRSGSCVLFYRRETTDYHQRNSDSSTSLFRFSR